MKNLASIFSVLCFFSFYSVSAIEVQSIKGNEVAALAKTSEKPTKQNPPLTLVNFWATWCPPCVEEFPELLKFHQKWKDKGVHLKLISADDLEEREKVKKFLTSRGVDFKTYIKDEDDDDFTKQVDPKWKGALPTSFLFDSSGKILYRWDSQVTVTMLEKVIQKFTTGENKK
jgi:thiol-disulfide isomerase/thioredoxin